MSDDERFERDLRAVVRAGLPDAAPAELRADARHIFETIGPADAHERGGRRPLGSVVALMAASLTVVALIGGLLLVGSRGTGPTASGSPSGSMLPSSSATAVLTPTATPRPSIASGSPTAAAAAPEVDAFGLIDARHGWAWSNFRLLLTADAGATWRVALTLIGDDQTGIVSFVDTQHGWVAPLERGQMARTVDGGATWQHFAIPPRYNLSGLRFFDASRGLLAFSGWGGGGGSVWSTTDGGASWMKVASMPPAIIGSVTWASPEVGWALAAADLKAVPGPPAWNRLDVTRDGGRTWSEVTLPQPSDFLHDATMPMVGRPVAIDAQTALVSVYYGTPSSGAWLLRTTDAGKTWTIVKRTAITMPSRIAATGNAAWIVSDEARQAASNTEVLVATQDGGQTWRTLNGVPDPGVYYVDIAFVDDRHGWVLDNGQAPLQLYATSDGGSSWRLLRPFDPTVKPSPTPTCSAESVVTGPGEGADAAPTPWFIVYPLYFDSGSQITLTFDQPVIAWPGAGAPATPFTSWTTSAANRKLSFRPVQATSRLVVTIQGGGCTATATADFTTTP